MGPKVYHNHLMDLYTSQSSGSKLGRVIPRLFSGHTSWAESCVCLMGIVCLGSPKTPSNLIVFWMFKWECAKFFVLSWTPAADAWLGAYLCEFWWGILTFMGFAWNCFRVFLLNGWKSMRFKTMKYHHVVNLRSLKESRTCWEEIQPNGQFLVYLGGFLYVCLLLESIHKRLSGWA